jgi:hypothetical protein
MQERQGPCPIGMASETLADHQQQLQPGSTEAGTSHDFHPASPDPDGLVPATGITVLP